MEKQIKIKLLDEEKLKNELLNYFLNQGSQRYPDDKGKDLAKNKVFDIKYVWEFWEDETGEIWTDFGCFGSWSPIGKPDKNGILKVKKQQQFYFEIQII